MGESKALARMEPSAGTSLAEYDPQKHNVLTPVTIMRAEDVSYLRQSIAVIRLSADPDAGDCYAAPGTTWGKDQRGRFLPDKVAPTKTGLAKIAAAMGVVIGQPEKITPASHRLLRELAAGAGITAIHALFDKVKYDVAYRVAIAVRDGLDYRYLGASYEWDLDAQERKIRREARKNAKKAAEKKPPQEFDVEVYVADRLDQVIAERHGLAETKAINRALRATGIKQVYTREEFGRPFVVQRIEFAPDMSDPAMQAAVVNKGLQSGAQIFAGASKAIEAGGVMTAGPDFEAAEREGRVMQMLPPGDEEEEEQAALPTGTQSATSEWPTDKEEPAEPTREEVCSEVLRLWGVAEKAVSDGRIEQMPPAPPAQDAPLPELQEWCKRCAGFLGAMTEAGDRAEPDTPAENGADAPTDTPAAEPTIGDLKNRILKVYGERGLNGPAQQKLLAQWADLRSIKPAPKVLSAGPMDDPALVADYLAFLTAGAAEGTTT